MHQIVLTPHFGAGRGRLARNGRATIYAVADPVASAAFAGWSGLVGARPAGDALDDLARLAQRSAVSALAAFVVDGDAIEVLTLGGAPITVDGRPLATGTALHRQRLDSASTIELLATGTLADDPLLNFEQGVVAADGFTLRRSAAGPTPWATEQPATPEPAPDPDPEVSIDAGVMGAAVAVEADAPAPDATPAPDPTPAPVAAAAPVVSLLAVDDDDLPDAEPLPIAGGPAPSMADPPPTEEMAAQHTEQMPATPGVVRVAGLRCARDHFNDPRARFCATCGIAMHQASFVLTEDVRPPLGVITFADGTFYAVSGNLVFGRDPDDDPAIRAGTASPAVLVDPANTISRVHAEVRAIEWDVYLVDRGSTNGTFVWNAHAQQWDRLAPDQPRVIEPGAQVSFGRLVAAFDSGLRP